MRMQRKHRIMVEVTFNQPMDDYEAVASINELIKQIDLQARPIWPNWGRDVYADRVRAKSLNRYLNWFKSKIA